MPSLDQARSDRNASRRTDVCRRTDPHAPTAVLQSKGGLFPKPDSVRRPSSIYRCATDSRLTVRNFGFDAALAACSQHGEDRRCLGVGLAVEASRTILHLKGRDDVARFQVQMAMLRDLVALLDELCLEPGYVR